MDNLIKIQCPHCQAIYKYPVKQLNAGIHSARCARCQNSFPIQQNLLAAQPKPAISTNTSAKPTPKSTKTQAKKIKPIADVSTALKANLASQTFVHQEDNASSVAIIAYGDDDDSDWLENLFNEPKKPKKQQRPNNIARSKTTTKSAKPVTSTKSVKADIKSPIAMKQQTKQPTSTKPVSVKEDENSKQNEIWPSDFIENLYHKVKKNQDVIESANKKKDSVTTNNTEALPNAMDASTYISNNNDDNNTASNSPAAINTKNTNRAQADSTKVSNNSGQKQPITKKQTINSQAINSQNTSSQAPLLAASAATHTHTTKDSIAPYSAPKSTAQSHTTKKPATLFNTSPKAIKDEYMQATTPSMQQINTHRSIYVSLFWTFGCLALLLLLLAQYVIFNLDNLIKNPNSQKKLAVFCHTVSCSLPSAELQNIMITHKTLRASKVMKGKTDILASLVNNSDQEQLYPNLHVRLYQDQTLLGEFIATPQDYLTVSQRILGRKQVKLFMLRVDIPRNKITEVDITPLY
ncbi:DUF3426 domain-containing protein [Psychrobacter sp. I-STPA10]|uniref:DUF3426 domain-containing protein n=1 Tax=Psychrobacter sp. I-STPA10 TaxID=2585769 RepID=UPI001E290BD0|nr:DUF3426 domain-containing protein [Psychrobacter sp. I-STPA10]